MEQSWHQVELVGWQVPFDLLLERSHLGSNDDLAEELRALADEVNKVAHPRAVWTRFPIDGIEADTVSLGGQRFRSAMLAKNLAAEKEAFPYIASCGPEIDEVPVGDPLAVFWLDEIKALALDAVHDEMREIVRPHLPSGRLNSMNPGSGAATLWPLQEQKPLFHLIGEEAQKWVGVKLTDTCLMHPNKSVSGMFFFGAEDFVSCAYCDRLDCIGRRAMRL